MKKFGPGGRAPGAPPYIHPPMLFNDLLLDMISVGNQRSLTMTSLQQ